MKNSNQSQMFKSEFHRSISGTYTAYLNFKNYEEAIQIPLSNFNIIFQNLIPVSIQNNCTKKKRLH
ncbi:45885_t:CDS:1, partial [Gigaspora margarita]